MHKITTTLTDAQMAAVNKQRGDTRIAQFIRDQLTITIFDFENEVIHYGGARPFTVESVTKTASSVQEFETDRKKMIEDGWKQTGRISIDPETLVISATFERRIYQ